MCRTATDGRHLADLVQNAIALCRAAQQQLAPRKGPGRLPVFEQWQIATMIFLAVAYRRKSKSSQYRFLRKRARWLKAILKLKRFPCRATYMERYSRAYPLLQQAIELQGRRALREHVSRARVVAADKSMIAAHGPPWYRNQRRADPLHPPHAVDAQAHWGRSAHDGWVWGYSYEIVVCATKNHLVFPLLASVDAANRSEHRSFPEKIPRLPPSTRHVLADGGYDGNEPTELIEYDHRGRRRRGHHFICPLLARGNKPAVGKTIHRGTREQRRRHRAAREKFYNSRRGQRLYARRGQTVEPFNQWFKDLFELQHHVWHRGLDNNRTMLLAALFCYQLVMRYSFKCGNRDGQIKWILDGL
jgi:hypothetical protein